MRYLPLMVEIQAAPQWAIGKFFFITKLLLLNTRVFISVKKLLQVTN